MDQAVVACPRCGRELGLAPMPQPSSAALCPTCQTPFTISTPVERLISGQHAENTMMRPPSEIIAPNEASRSERPIPLLTRRLLRPSPTIAALSQLRVVLPSTLAYLVLLGLLGIWCAHEPVINLLLVVFGFWGPLLAGPLIIALAQLNGRSWTFRTFFAGLAWYVPLYWLQLQTLFVALPCLILPMGLLRGIVPLPLEVLFTDGVTRLVLGSLGMCAYFTRLLFALPLLLERNCRVYYAIRDSWTLTRGHFWNLFAFVLSVVLINVGCALIHPAVLLAALPVTYLLWAACYLDYTRQLGHAPNRVGVGKEGDAEEGEENVNSQAEDRITVAQDEVKDDRLKSPAGPF
jgi:Membrane domain of glycerophosphoryl diester phosphodiesterase